MSAQPEKLRVRNHLLTAVFYGALAWLIYGIVELCCLAVLPWAVQPDYAYKPYDPRFNALLLGLYALVGSSIGLGTSFVVPAFCKRLQWLQSSDTPRVVRAGTTAILVLVLLANLGIIWNRSRPFSPSILMINLLFLLAATFLSAGSGPLSRRFYPFAGAWLPSALYLVSQWLGEWLGNRGAAPLQTNGCILVLTLGFYLLAFWIGRTAYTNTRVLPTRLMLAVSALAIACCALTAALQPRPYTASVSMPPAPSARPNVILVSLDTVRADHLSVYGYERDTTPNLKNFATEAVLFTRAVSSSDMTLPSHASIFTGLYASQHGAHFSEQHRLGVPLDYRFLTLAEILHGKGYWTAGVVANGGYLSGTFGLNQGFTYWDQRLPSMVLAPVPDYFVRARLRGLTGLILPTSELDRVSRSAEQINQGVLTALEKRPGGGRPFLLFINYMDAHVPYIPPAPFDGKFSGKDPKFTEARYISTYFDVMARKRKIDARTHEHLISQYDAAIAYLDAQLASLFAHLKELGLYDNSLIILTSDHGEAFGERHYMDHGGMSAYGDQILVPLLIKYPNTRDRAIVEQSASSVDLLPTILDTVGFPVPEGLPGQNLRIVSMKERDVISESFPGGRAYYTNAATFNRIHRTIISGSFKFIAGSSGRPELYNLQHDPGESKNLYHPHDPKSLELAARLSAWSRAVAQKSGSGVKLDSETLERLKSLGYVQ